MEDIRKNDSAKKEDVRQSLIDSYEIDQEYIQEILANNPLAQKEDAEEFFSVLVEFQVSGKKAALNRFDTFVENIAKRDPQNAVFIVPYFCGALYPNGIVSQEESNDLSKKYVQKLIGIM